MQKQRLQSAMYMAIIASETSHVFCCVLPTVFSVVSLLAGLGMVTAMPGWLHSLHETMHGWELPLIIMSAVVIALGWALHMFMQNVHDHEHCSHGGGCAPKKKTAKTILKIATALFVVNVLVYLVFHKGMSVFMPEDSATVIVQSQEHDDSHRHGQVE